MGLPTASGSAPAPRGRAHRLLMQRTNRCRLGCAPAGLCLLMAHPASARRIFTRRYIYDSAPIVTTKYSEKLKNGARRGPGRVRPALTNRGSARLTISVRQQVLSPARPKNCAPNRRQV